MALPGRTVLTAWEKSNGACWYCGAFLSQNSPELTIDHLRPRSRGGTDLADNLVLCCRRCNTLKGVGTVEELRVKLGRVHGQHKPPPGLIAVVAKDSRRIAPRRLEPRELFEFHFEKASLVP